MNKFASTGHVLTEWIPYSISLIGVLKLFQAVFFMSLVSPSRYKPTSLTLCSYKPTQTLAHLPTAYSRHFTVSRECRPNCCVLTHERLKKTPVLRE